MRRLIVLGATLAAAGVAAYAASAARFGPFASAAAGGGSAAIAPCDGDGVTIAYTTSGGNVTAATVGSLADPGCEGGALVLVVTGVSGASIANGGPVTVPTDADTSPNAVGVTLSPQPAAQLVAGYHVAITGP